MSERDWIRISTAPRPWLARRCRHLSELLFTWCCQLDPDWGWWRAAPHPSE